MIITECIHKFASPKASGVHFEDVNVGLKLLFLKQIHATWLMEISLFSQQVKDELV